MGVPLLGPKMSENSGSTMFTLLDDTFIVMLMRSSLAIVLSAELMEYSERRN